MNARLTLRAWLNFSLEPFRLTYVPDKDGLQDSPPHRTQQWPLPTFRSANERTVTTLLRVRFGHEFGLIFTGNLSSVVAFFQMKTKESFVLLPSALKAGTLDAKALVGNPAIQRDQPVSVSLKRLLEGHGIVLRRFVTRRS